jgi:hypothetical protein
MNKEREIWLRMFVRALSLTVGIAILLGSGPLNELFGQPEMLKESEEPPQTLELTLDGDSVFLELEAEKEVQLDDETRVVRIRKHPFRTLRVQHLSFEYPSSFHFEAEVAPSLGGFSVWNLEGREVKLSLQRMSNAVTFADYVAEMRDEFTSDNGTHQVTAENPTALQLASRKIHGTRLQVSTPPDVELSAEYLDLLEVDNCRYVLVIAYSPQDGEEEADTVRQLLRRSLRFSESDG